MCPRRRGRSSWECARAGDGDRDGAAVGSGRPVVPAGADRGGGVRPLPRAASAPPSARAGTDATGVRGAAQPAPGGAPAGAVLLTPPSWTTGRAHRPPHSPFGTEMFRRRTALLV